MYNHRHVVGYQSKKARSDFTKPNPVVEGINGLRLHAIQPIQFTEFDFLTYNYNTFKCITLIFFNVCIWVMYLFKKKKCLNECDIQLVEGFLIDLIGQSEKTCKRQAEDQGFIFLDSWSTKLGFARENAKRTLILSLFFEDGACQDFYLIAKSGDSSWNDAEMIDCDTVKAKLTSRNGET